MPTEESVTLDLRQDRLKPGHDANKILATTNQTDSGPSKTKAEQCSEEEIKNAAAEMTHTIVSTPLLITAMLALSIDEYFSVQHMWLFLHMIVSLYFCYDFLTLYSIHPLTCTNYVPPNYRELQRVGIDSSA